MRTHGFGKIRISGLSAVVVVAAFFFFAYTWVSHRTGETFTWPDERANHFFSTQFADNSTLRHVEPLNEIADGLVRPRSTSYINGAVVPTSFLGMPVVYGLLAKAFGSSVLPYITPFLAVIGGVSLFLLLRNIFGKHTAFISTVLLFTFPPYWYYAMHGMLHNIAFTTLLIIGLYFFDFQRHRRISPHLAATLSGISIGMAVYIRTSEAIWVVPLLIVLSWIWYHHDLPRSLATFWGSVALFILIIGYSNMAVYGSPFSFGYSPDTVRGSLGTATTTLLQKARTFVLPFGLDLRQSVTVFYSYIVAMFPWFSIPLIIASVWVVKDQSVRLLQYFTKVQSPRLLNSPAERVYALSYIVVTLWLIIYYGSFTFSEHLFNDGAVLGTSYHRYWLPICIFGLPLCVIFLQRLVLTIHYGVVRYTVFAFCVVSFFMLSLQTIVTDPVQGVLQTRSYLIEDMEKQKEILDITESASVIVTRRYDKVIFPKRRVISVTSTTQEFTDMLHRLVRVEPVYFLFSSHDSQDVMLKSAIDESVLHVVEVREWPADAETFYQIVSD